MARSEVAPEAVETSREVQAVATLTQALPQREPT